VGFVGLLVLDGLKDFVTINGGAALLDNSIADLADKDHKTGWGIVVLRVVPDKKDSVHNGDENLSNFGKFLRCVTELVEKLTKGLEVLVVLIGFFLSDLNLLLKLAEG
jgi:hypothetical protein